MAWKLPLWSEADHIVSQLERSLAYWVVFTLRVYLAKQLHDVPNTTNSLFGRTCLIWESMDLQLRLLLTAIRTLKNSSARLKKNIKSCVPLSTIVQHPQISDSNHRHQPYSSQSQGKSWLQCRIHKQMVVVKDRTQCPRVPQPPAFARFAS